MISTKYFHLILSLSRFNFSMDFISSELEKITLHLHITGTYAQKWPPKMQEVLSRWPWIYNGLNLSLVNTVDTEIPVE